MHQKGKTSSLKDWKGVFAKFEAPWDPRSLTRHDSSRAHWRAAGPNLAVLTTLLGEEGTRNRLERVSTAASIHRRSHASTVRLYNTRSRSVEDFQPVVPEKIGIYVWE